MNKKYSELKYTIFVFVTIIIVIGIAFMYIT